MSEMGIPSLVLSKIFDYVAEEGQINVHHPDFFHNIYHTLRHLNVVFPAEMRFYTITRLMENNPLQFYLKHLQHLRHKCDCDYPYDNKYCDSCDQQYCEYCLSECEGEGCSQIICPDHQCVECDLWLCEQCKTNTKEQTCFYCERNCPECNYLCLMCNHWVCSRAEYHGHDCFEIIDYESRYRKKWGEGPEPVNCSCGEAIVEVRTEYPGITFSLGYQCRKCLEIVCSDCLTKHNCLVKM